MLKIYCTECGSPTSYTSAKPKFCSACGTPFDKIVVNKTLLQKPTITRQEPLKKIIPKVQSNSNFEDQDNDDYDSEDINYVPDISSLDCEIEASKTPKIKIGDVLGTGEKQSREKIIKNKKLSKNQQKIENQKFMESWKKEAGSIRPKPSRRGPKDG